MDHFISFALLIFAMMHVSINVVVNGGKKAKLHEARTINTHFNVAHYI